MIPRDRLFTAQHQAGLHRLFTQMVGKHLIHADPTLERRPFLQRSTEVGFRSARDEYLPPWRSC